jgi:hypothetical protein
MTMRKIQFSGKLREQSLDIAICFTLAIAVVALVRLAAPLGAIGQVLAVGLMFIIIMFRF